MACNPALLCFAAYCTRTDHLFVLLQQYWANTSAPYKYVSVADFAEMFKRSSIGAQIIKELEAPTQAVAKLDPQNPHEVIPCVLARGFSCVGLSDGCSTITASVAQTFTEHTHCVAVSAILTFGAGSVSAWFKL